MKRVATSRAWGTTLWPAAAVAAVAAIAVVGTTQQSPATSARQPRAGSLPVLKTTLVCPNVTGSSTAPTVMSIANASAAVSALKGGGVTVTTRRLGAPASKPTVVNVRGVTRSRVTVAGKPVVIEANGEAAAAIVADQSRLIPRGPGRGLFSAPCLAPDTDFWLTGPDGRVGYTDLLVLANPGSVVANVTVTAWALSGRLEPPKLQSFTVAPNAAAFLPVANYTPDAANVSMHVHANTGRVTAIVVDRRVTGVHAAGVDWIPPTRPPAKHVVVPGFIGGVGGRRLIVGNPGNQDATVSLRLSTPSGNFAPAGQQTVVVRAGHTANIDLAGPLNGGPGAVILRSDVPVTAAGISSADSSNRKLLSDTQWQPAARPITGPAVLPDNTPPFGRVSRINFTAPEATARIRVATVTGAAKTVTVRAGRMLSWDPVAAFGTAAYGPLVLTHVDGGPAYASRTLYAFGLHGPLTTSEQPTPLPRRVSLPPVTPDLRAAVP